MSRQIARRTRMGLLVPMLLLPVAGVCADEGVVPFDSERWTLGQAQLVEHLGRRSLMGTAVLEDVEFGNGVIEVDIAVTGRRSYPGVTFRRRTPTDVEQFYIRPHRANGAFSDALQYTPVINGIAGWQLYSGDGHTAPAEIPTGRWVHLKLEIHGTQGRVWLDDAEQPGLEIHELKLGPGKGAVGVMGPVDGTAYFSNFSYRADDSLQFAPAPETPVPLGMIDAWELSRAFRYSQIDIERTPQQQGLEGLAWKSVTAEASGLLDIARFIKRTPGEPEFVWARKMLHAETARTLQLEFGYSDYVSIFLNGRLLFAGNSAYRSRSPGFAGIVGLNDTLYLPLEKGENELLLLVGESFGGWGLICRDADAVFVHDRLSRSWEIAQTLKFPESVVWDGERQLLYVSNFFNGGDEFLSRVRLDGTIETLEWVTGLDRPTGLCLAGDRLYAVERTGLLEIDRATGEIATRYPFVEPGFPNDVACGRTGEVYVSDTRRNAIYRLEDGKLGVWLEGGEISGPNALLLDGDSLVVGNSGDGCLKRVSLADRTVEPLACLGSGSVMDGLRPDGAGGYVASDYNGRVFLVSASGSKTELLNTTARGVFCADLEFVAERGLIVVPTLNDNRLLAYELAPE